MRNPLILLFWLIVLGGILNYYLSGPGVSYEARHQMREAYVAYVKGETAGTIGERKEAFNKALELYTGLEKQYQPSLSTGKLQYNIANSYFQLGEYPWALLYYYRAEQLMPRDEKTKHNLQVVLNKLGIVKTKENPVFKRIFFFYHYLSLPEKLQTFFTFSLIGLIFSSLFIWKQMKWMKWAAFAAAIPAAIMLLTLGYSHYIAPIEAVIVHSSSLYRDAGFQYAKVLDDPILSGNKVEVLDSLKEGKWLKVLTPGGNLGYVPADAIRII